MAQISHLSTLKCGQNEEKSGELIFFAVLGDHRTSTLGVLADRHGTKVPLLRKKF